MLEVSDIETYYGDSQALFGLSLTVQPGQVVTLIGRNGMGKTTTVNSIMGIVPIRRGQIRYQNELISGQPSFQVSGKGIGLVPEGRQIFPNLSVRENLVATAANMSNTKDPWVLDKILEFFPGLKNRMNNMGGQLSGGNNRCSP